jgi:acetyl esterase/lipase
MTVLLLLLLLSLLNFTSLSVQGFRASIRRCRVVQCPLLSSSPAVPRRSSNDMEREQSTDAAPLDVMLLPVVTKEPPISLQQPWNSLPPPPTDPKRDPANDVWRAMRRTVPRWVQQRVLRDGAWLRWLVDTSSVVLAAPTIARQYPNALRQFVRLSYGTWAPRILQMMNAIFSRKHGRNDDELSNVSLQVISYGSDHRQVIHLLRQQQQRHDENPHRVVVTVNSSVPSPPPRSMVVFVHGGAWGSGFPALYRLAAVPFLNTAHNNCTVAILGYRTYPTVAAVDDQVDDVARALDLLVAQERPSSVVLVGHSSGAHLIALGLRQGRLTANRCTTSGFVGIAGVYDIVAHYRHEAARGVERISPMAPICGGSVAAWRKNSPTHLAKTVTATVPNESDGSILSNDWPPTLLLHGVCDSTVPYTSSVQFYDTIASTNPTNRLHLLPDTEHAEPVLQLMFGGPTRAVVMNWIASLPDYPCPQH